MVRQTDEWNNYNKTNPETDSRMEIYDTIQITGRMERNCQ